MKHKLLLFALCLAVSLSALLLASTSSPVYATNFWTDSNIYMTMGRGILAGKVPYRDLFDHKGPLTFFIYAAGALMDGSGFAGLFVMEVLSLAAVLLAGAALLSWTGRGAAWPLLPLISLSAVCCTAFNQGGSAEEFCLPFLAWSAALAGRQLSGGGKRDALAFGLCTGMLGMIKYTVIGMNAGLFAFWLLHSLRRREGIRTLLGFAAGVALAVLPFALYFGSAHAIGAALDGYLWQNLRYAGEPMSLTGHLYNALAYLRTQSVINPFPVVLCMLGMAGWILEAVRRRSFLLLPAFPASLGLLLLTVYWGEMAHPYYALVFAAPGILAFLLLPRCPVSRLPLRLQAAAFALLGLLALPSALLCCRAPELLRVRREDMPQVHFAKIMEEEHPGATLLDLTGHDQGFYLACGTLPVTRYFCDNNLNSEEKKAALEGYLAEARTDYVVCVWRTAGERYEQVAEEDGLFDLASEKHYVLYRRKEVAHGAVP